MKTETNWFVWKFFREEFRQMYGSVSVAELATNRVLSNHIQKIETALREVMNSECRN